MDYAGLIKNGLTVEQNCRRLSLHQVNCATKTVTVCKENAVFVRNCLLFDAHRITRMKGKAKQCETTEKGEHSHIAKEQK